MSNRRSKSWWGAVLASGGLLLLSLSYTVVPAATLPGRVGPAKPAPPLQPLEQPQPSASSTDIRRAADLAALAQLIRERDAWRDPAYGTLGPTERASKLRVLDAEVERRQRVLGVSGAAAVPAIPYGADVLLARAGAPAQPSAATPLPAAPAPSATAEYKPLDLAGGAVSQPRVPAPTPRTGLFVPSGTGPKVLPRDPALTTPAPTPGAGSAPQGAGESPKKETGVAPRDPARIEDPAMATPAPGVEPPMKPSGLPNDLPYGYEALGRAAGPDREPARPGSTEAVIQEFVDLFEGIQLFEELQDPELIARRDLAFRDYLQKLKKLGETKKRTDEEREKRERQLRAEQAELKRLKGMSPQELARKLEKDAWSRFPDANHHYPPRTATDRAFLARFRQDWVKAYQEIYNTHLARIAELGSSISQLQQEIEVQKKTLQDDKEATANARDAWRDLAGVEADRIEDLLERMLEPQSWRNGQIDERIRSLKGPEGARLAMERIDSLLSVIQRVAPKLLPGEPVGGFWGWVNGNRAPSASLIALQREISRHIASNPSGFVRLLLENPSDPRGGETNLAAGADRGGRILAAILGDGQGGTETAYAPIQRDLFAALTQLGMSVQTVEGARRLGFLVTLVQHGKEQAIRATGQAETDRADFFKNLGRVVTSGLPIPYWSGPGEYGKQRFDDLGGDWKKEVQEEVERQIRESRLSSDTFLQLWLRYDEILLREARGMIAQVKGT